MTNQDKSAKYWNDKGYFPTTDIRLFRTSKGWLSVWDTYLLKQRWQSEWGYEDIWLTLLKEQNGEDCV